MTIVGADLRVLVSAGGTLAGVPAASEQQADPPDLRAYDAADGVLFALHSSSSAASIDTVDVDAALQDVVATTTTPIVGLVPAHPLAPASDGDTFATVPRLLSASAVHAGLELAFVPHEPSKLIDLVTRPTEDLKPGVCGAGWLRHHADATGPGFALVPCASEASQSDPTDPF